jgi:signal transduction histidine kinase
MYAFPTNEYFDLSPSGILIYDPQGLCYANPAAISLLSSEEFPLFPGSPLPERWQEALSATSAVVTISGIPFQLFPRTVQQGQLIELHPLTTPGTDTISALRRVSQQLREPLSRLMGAVEGWNREDSSPAQLTQQAQSLRNLCQLLHTVNAIQLYSDLAEEVPFSQQVLELSALCRTLCQELSSLLEAVQVKFTYSLQDCTLVLGNAALLRQLLLQLVSNALAAGANQLSLTLSATRSKVTLTLKDNGSGFPAHRLSTAFSPASASDDPGDNGFNLGLPLCQKIAQLHQGSLLLSADPKGGTAVSLTLPRSSGSTATVRAPQADLSGGIPDFLVELSRVLPPSCYVPELL